MLEATVPAPTAWQPHEYQKSAIKFLLEHACAGLFLSPGLGKTSIVLGAVSVLKKQQLLKSVLVVAPLRVCHSVWPKEIEKWADFSHLKVVVLHGGKKEHLLKEKNVDVWVINFDGLEWLMSDDRFKQLGVDTLVIDESSKLKNTATRRFKTLKPVLKKFARRWILSGTPAPNGLMDVFGQIYILDLGNALGPYITKYRQEFFDPTGFGGYAWRIKEGGEERIHELLRPLVLRLDSADYLELPKLITTPQTDIVVDLPPKARKIYDDLEEEMIATLDNLETVTALSAAAASMKCRQVANGGIYRQLDHTPATTQEQWQHLHDAKTDALEDLVEELAGNPVLVAYEFRHDMDRIRKRFPRAVFASDYPASKFPLIEAKWNAGEIEMLVGQPQSVGHGLNLQGSNAKNIVWYGSTWNLEDYEQFVLRILRQGNTSSHVFNYHIVARNTVDQAIMRALKSKAKVQNKLLAALKEYKQERGK